MPNLIIRAEGLGVSVHVVLGARPSVRERRPAAATAAVLPSSLLHTTSLLLLLLIQHSPRLIPETIGSKNMQPSLNEMFPVAEKAGKN